MIVRIEDQDGKTEVESAYLDDVLPGDENAEEREKAREELLKVGRYWVGGGAAPLLCLRML